jgi:hypothetical protein
VFHFKRVRSLLAPGRGSQPYETYQKQYQPVHATKVVKRRNFRNAVIFRSAGLISFSTFVALLNSGIRLRKPEFVFLRLYATLTECRGGPPAGAAAANNHSLCKT